ncbi:family 16 glycoside hydrolase [Hyphococcus luteus]|uniref:3-keto-alpha-glucoside-1,2-lyase/3-keto-2-hydroxy-glucal hydratase domain-containing protein n=1 Tax=Hyphococcus luteus TaxID=2058213 RepID=A0A2S7K846_9PROT|nr:family 16 glycoside hydrolase [Marinicaulis flavus]PQA88639.1 hypothetical protein CW354_10185 [Marinicaulis flavus]
MRLTPATLFLSLTPVCACAQSGSAPETLDFDGKTWRVTAQEARAETYNGREILVLKGGRVWLDDIAFKDGVIEFDAAYDEVQGFIGPLWRAESDRRFEEIYFRSHLNEKPDAVQYTPVENGNSAWQIFSDENAIAPVSQNYDDWNHVKVVVKGDKADFYFNGDEPALHVPDLKTDVKSGYVGLRVTGAATVRFSNIVFRPLRKGEKIVGEAKETAPLPEGLIKKWSVSSVFPEAEIADALTLRPSAGADLSWAPLAVETNGIANISRLHERLPGADSTVFIRLTINSDAAQMKELRFGYSDRVRIYLNGKRVYFGDAGWAVRDYRFLGTVGFFDIAGLDLKQGDNELMIAVSETFGGWAFAGAIADQNGIGF